MPMIKLNTIWVNTDIQATVPVLYDTKKEIICDQCGDVIPPGKYWKVEVLYWSDEKHQETYNVHYRIPTRWSK